jgi:hypothetical protein
MADTINITAAEHKFYLGEDKILVFTISQASGSIAGWAMALVIKASLSAGAPELLSKTIGAGLTITADGPPGVVEAAFEDVDTDGSVYAFLPGMKKDRTPRYYYSLKRLDPGQEAILTEGSWEFAVATQIREA